MRDRFGRPWVVAVLIGYATILAGLFLWAAAPWNWLLAVIITAKGLGFYALIRRLDAIGRPAPVRALTKAETAPVKSKL